jgi:hypothetical protein
MHDPNTQVLSWPRHDSWLYKHTGTLLTIWHVDPCADGSDNSCGWSFVKIPKRVHGELDFAAWCEAKRPWFQRELSKQPQNVADAEHLLRGLVLEVANTCRLRISYAKACEIAASLMHNQVDNVRSSMCFAPGYHTNCRDDRESDRQEHALSLFRCIARVLLTDARPWYRHPRWHFRHWHVELFGMSFGRTMGDVDSHPA